MTKFEWISNIISTSTTDFHFEATEKLIDMYYETDKDEAKTHELRVLLINQYNSIFERIVKAIHKVNNGQ